jgi:hypothetical protein
MRAREKVENIVMKAGSGHNTPNPTIDARDAAIVTAVLSVGAKLSTGPASLALT